VAGTSGEAAAEAVLVGDRDTINLLEGSDQQETKRMTHEWGARALSSL